MCSKYREKWNKLNLSGVKRLKTPLLSSLSTSLSITHSIPIYLSLSLSLLLSLGQPLTDLSLNAIALLLCTLYSNTLLLLQLRSLYTDMLRRASASGKSWALMPFQAHMAVNHDPYSIKSLLFSMYFTNPYRIGVKYSLLWPTWKKVFFFFFFKFWI